MTYRVATMPATIPDDRPATVEPPAVPSRPVTAEQYFAMPAYGSGAVSASCRDQRDGGRSFYLGHIVWPFLRMCDRSQVEPIAMAEVMKSHGLPTWIDIAALSEDAVLARHAARDSSRAMRAGSLLEAGLYSPGDADEWRHASDGATKGEVVAAQKEIALVKALPSTFPTANRMARAVAAGTTLTQDVASAELRPNLWCKARGDLTWQLADGVNVELDVKRWTGWPNWRTDDDVVAHAVRVGAHWQRALYRRVYEVARGGQWRSLILALDPVRSQPAEALVELPPDVMNQAADEVEEALDGIAAMMNDQEMNA